MINLHLRKHPANQVLINHCLLYYDCSWEFRPIFAVHQSLPIKKILYCLSPAITSINYFLYKKIYIPTAFTYFLITIHIFLKALKNYASYYPNSNFHANVCSYPQVLRYPSIPLINFPDFSDSPHLKLSPHHLRNFKII